MRIDEIVARTIEDCLQKNELCEFPRVADRDQPIVIDYPIAWHTPASLILTSQNDIIFGENASINITEQGTLTLRAGYGNKDNIKSSRLSIDKPIGTVKFPDTSKKFIFLGQNCQVIIQYNGVVPKKFEATNKHRYESGGFHMLNKIQKNARSSKVGTYQYINDIYDLQNIHKGLWHSYALSQDIDASDTAHWFNGKGFHPLRAGLNLDDTVPFSGDFEGNGFTIKNLFINRSDENSVGLFGMAAHSIAAPSEINNLVLENTIVYGREFTGALIGVAKFTHISNVTISNSTIYALAVSGSLFGTGNDIFASDIAIRDSVVIAEEFYGMVFGTLHCVTFDKEKICSDLSFKTVDYGAIKRQSQRFGALNNTWLDLNKFYVKKKLSTLVPLQNGHVFDKVQYTLNAISIPAEEFFGYPSVTERLSYSLMKTTDLTVLSFVTGLTSSICNNLSLKQVSPQLLSQFIVISAMFALDYSLLNMFVLTGFQLLLQQLGCSKKQAEIMSWSLMIVLNLLEEEPIQLIADTLVGMLGSFVGNSCGKAVGNRISGYVCSFFSRKKFVLDELKNNVLPSERAHLLASNPSN